MILPPRLKLLADVPYLRLFFGPRDIWWRFSADRALTMRNILDVRDRILDYGVPWLEQRP